VHPSDAQGCVQAIGQRRNDLFADPALDGRYLEQQGGDEVEQTNQRRK
jgi:hypothetical protein